jgi:hypothetical protein
LDDLADGPGGSGDGPGVQEQPGGPEVRRWPGMECGSRPARSQPGGPGARPEGLGDGLRRFGSPWEPAEGSENRPGGSGDGLEGLELGQVIREPAGRFVSWAKPGCPGHSRYVWEQGCRSRSGRQKMKKPPGGLESRPGGLEASSGGFAGPEAGQEICEPAGKSGRLAGKSGRSGLEVGRKVRETFERSGRPCHLLHQAHQHSPQRIRNERIRNERIRNECSVTEIHHAHSPFISQNHMYFQVRNPSSTFSE